MEFSEELRLFRERTHDPGYRGLILLGTGQAVTAALLLGTLRLERVAILLSPEAKEEGFADKVAELLGPASTDWDLYDLPDTSTTEVYRKLKQVLDSWQDLPAQAIAADLTGGMKQMTVGLAKAAHLLNLPTIHVTSDYSFDEKLRRKVPLAGTQQLQTLPDPFLVFGDLEAAEARRLYSAHDYPGAARIFAELARRLAPLEPDQGSAAGEGGVALALEYAAYAALANAYAAWDAFEFAAAQQMLAALADGPLPEAAQRQRSTLLAQAVGLRHLNMLASLEQHGAAGPPVVALADLQFMLPLLGSLHSSALRRAETGRYDFAAYLQYRCLELIEQHRLACYGILTEIPRWQALLHRYPDLETRYKEVQTRQSRFTIYGLPSRAIGLFQGYMLLEALGDKLVAGYNIRQIEKSTGARNKSFLAHGYRPITAGEYDDFAAVVEEILERFFAVAGLDQRHWEQSYHFVAPFVTSNR